MKINIKQYLLITSVFAIFTEGLFFNFIIDWKLIYLIVISNYFILIKYYKLKLNKYFIFLLLVLLLHAVIINAILKIPPNYMLSQIIGMAIMGIYYYNFVSVISLNSIIKTYSKMALAVAVIGYVLYFTKFHPLSYYPDDNRFMSIFKEPAHYVVVVLPACYYYLKTRKIFLFLIMLGTIILSNSSLGYIGSALMFIVPNLTLNRIKYLLFTLPFIYIAFFYVYNEYEFLKVRVDDTIETLKAVKTGKFKEETNLSSYALLSNIYIAKENFLDHPFGSGMGSHLFMHTNVYGTTMRPPDYLKQQNLQNSNATDANSLFTRMVSELGILGLLIIVFLLYKSSVCFKHKELIFSQGIFIYFLLKLIRDGHYFAPELYLFVWLAYFEIKYFQIKKAQ